MAKYVDGFVLTVPEKRLGDYKKMAKEAAGVWKRFGALEYKECVMDDPTPKDIVFTFPKMTKAKPGEKVVFAYVVYKSKSHRAQVNKKVFGYFEKKYQDASKEMQNMPFDMKRMAYGGFQVLVEA